MSAGGAMDNSRTRSMTTIYTAPEITPISNRLSKNSELKIIATIETRITNPKLTNNIMNITSIHVVF